MAAHAALSRGERLRASTLSNPKLLWAFAWAAVGSVLVTQIRVLQDVFRTTPLTGNQWALCLATGILLLLLGEVTKIVLRARRSRAEPAPAVAVAHAPG